MQLWEARQRCNDTASCVQMLVSYCVKKRLFYRSLNGKLKHLNWRKNKVCRPRHHGHLCLYLCSDVLFRLASISKCVIYNQAASPMIQSNEWWWWKVDECECKRGADNDAVICVVWAAISIRLISGLYQTSYEYSRQWQLSIKWCMCGGHWNLYESFDNGL